MKSPQFMRTCNVSPLERPLLLGIIKAPTMNVGAFLFLSQNQTSIFAYFAFFSMNSRLGGTSSPINIEKI